jgi:clan AA aspartic protease
MISGSIRNREAIIELEVSAAGQPPQQIEAVIDTGYNGYLTLPSQLVTAISLPFAGHRRGTLADGSVTRLDVYLATVVWHGRQKDVLISQASGTPTTPINANPPKVPRSGQFNGTAKLPGPPARTLKLGKPGWRPRLASAVG